jgi:phosphohistidine phosphatase
MELYLVRHAEAAPGEPDELRTLTPEGREAARALGEQLAAEGVQVDAVLTSPLLRARETGEAIAAALECGSEPTDELAFGATTESLRRAISGRGETVVAVGHQPDCGRIAAELTGGDEPPFPPGGMVRIEVA